MMFPLAEKAVAVEREQDDIVIAADTIVVCDGAVLGKPKDEAQAKQMLARGEQPAPGAVLTPLAKEILEAWVSIFASLESKESKIMVCAKRTDQNPLPGKYHNFAFCFSA